MAKKKALITGVTGQDGAYLSRFLLSKGYKVYGTFRRASTPNFWRLQYLDVFDKIELLPVDLIDSGSIFEAIEVAKPDEVYHLAAQSFVGTSFEQPVSTGEITALGCARVLEAIRSFDKSIRFYQASTSELYGDGQSGLLSETTPFEPSSPYAAAKLYGFWLTAIYRQAYDCYACNGILFNHESPIRGLEFVTRKITNAVARIACGLQKKLVVGNLDAKRDWGYAPEYVEAMWLILQQKKPDDYVIATGETHTVREFIQKAFACVDLDWKKHVEVDPRFIRPLDVNYLCGDIKKVRKDLGWKPKTRFDGLVRIMVDEDLRRWENYLKGERFPWDAINYPGDSNMYTRNLKEYQKRK
jgi:GDPmannose 4,6-dehydratase